MPTLKLRRTMRVIYKRTNRRKGFKHLAPPATVEPQKPDHWFSTYRNVMVYLSPMLAMNMGIHVKSGKAINVKIVGPTLKALDRLAVEITDQIEARR